MYCLTHTRRKLPQMSDDDSAKPTDGEPGGVLGDAHISLLLNPLITAMGNAQDGQTDQPAHQAPSLQ